MASPDPIEPQGAAQDSWFGSTHWTMVRLAGQKGAPRADEALAKLCEACWYPLYVFVRRQGQRPEDAQDLVQGFFAQLLEKNYLRDVDREKGRFRSFLLLALKRFMANEWDKANRLKRGGGQDVISLDEEQTGIRYRAEPSDDMTPDKALEQQWALTLLEKVLDRLGAEYAAAGKAGVFEELKPFLRGEKSQRPYSEIAESLGMSEANLKVTVHRLRHRYRELLKLEIANTVASPKEIEDEIRHLLAALS